MHLHLQQHLYTNYYNIQQINPGDVKSLNGLWLFPRSVTNKYILYIYSDKSHSSQVYKSINILLNNLNDLKGQLVTKILFRPNKNNIIHQIFTAGWKSNIMVSLIGLYNIYQIEMGYWLWCLLVGDTLYVHLGATFGERQ